MNQPINIFLLMGQSNMAGRGDLQTVVPIHHPDILMFRDRGWETAEEPLHTDKPEIAGVGLAMSFAAEVLKQMPDARIGLVPCAMGGSPLSDWMPGAELYTDAVALTRRAMCAGSLTGILWHQGEADSQQHADADSYGQRLETMINTLRSELDADTTPVIAGELGPFLTDHDGMDLVETVNHHLRELQRVLPMYRCASADGLTDQGDQVHFDAESLRRFGVRYARKYLEIRDSSSAV